MVTVLRGTALAQDITSIRDASTPTSAFRAAVHRIGLHLAVAASNHLPARDVVVTTPLATTTGRVIDGDVVIVPILRAGLGLLQPFLDVLPSASVGYIGMRRNEATLEPEEYYHNIPVLHDTSTVIVIDPMLATGGSMSDAITFVRQSGGRSVIAVCLIAAPEGIARIQRDHPDTRIIVGVEDEGLNANGYIMPGLGDAGDRLFGTA
jgi:uracil phosphoribosyltransferase